MTALEYISNLEVVSRKNIATERIKKRWAMLAHGVVPVYGSSNTQGVQPNKGAKAAGKGALGFSATMAVR